MSKFSDSKYHSWIKAGLAVLYTKQGIEPFVYDEIQQFQLKSISDICYNNHLMSGTTCGICRTENIVVCLTDRICNAGRKQCAFHRNNVSQYNPAGCPSTICNNFKKEIQKAHRYCGPSYRNTDVTQWCSNPWEVAKCFMPPDGYKDVTSAAQTDFNGIINVIINHCGVQAKVNDNLGNKNNIFEKARVIGREVRHSPSLEIDDTDLQQYFNDLQTLLSDPGYLATNKDAQNARQKLIQLQNDTLVIGIDDVRKVLDDVAKAVQDKIKNAIDKQKKEAEKQNLDLINTSRAAIDAFKNQEKVSLSELENALSSALHQIKEKTEDSIKTIENKTKEGLVKIDDKMDASMKTLETKRVKEIEQIQKELDVTKETVARTIDQGIESLQDIAEREQESLTELGQTIKGSFSSAEKQKEERMYNNLREDLIQHYREQYSTLLITPLLDEIMDLPLLEMYVPPFPMVSVETDNFKLLSEQATDATSLEAGIQVKCLSDVFNKTLIPCKNIYISAEPGCGKTSFVKWLALTWCQAQLPLEKYAKYILDTDLQQMREFEFVFLVLLRYTNPQESNIETMLANNLIKLLGRQSMYPLGAIEMILSSKKCLVIIDGLDEWSSYNGPNALPQRAARESCTCVTTSRPWKMAEVPFKSSQIDARIKITNLQGICTYKLLPKIISILKKNNCLRIDGHEESFGIDLKILGLPVEYLTFLQMVGNSRCQIYSNIANALLERADKKGSILSLMKYKNVLPSGLKYFESEAVNCQTYYKLLHDLGKVAFWTLFSDQKESSLVFKKEQVTTYLQNEKYDEFLDTVVKVGLLSKEMHLSPKQKEYSYSFYHKTIQEYFAALFIQSVPVDQHVIEQIKARCNTLLSVLEMETVFVFLSGFNPEVASEVLQNLQEAINEDPKTKHYRSGAQLDILATHPDIYMKIVSRQYQFDFMEELQQIQDMIVSCLAECRSSGHISCDSMANNTIQFPLNDLFMIPKASGKVSFDSYWSCLEYIITCNATRMKSVFITGLYSPDFTAGLVDSLTYQAIESVECLNVGGQDNFPFLHSLDKLVNLKSIKLHTVDIGEGLVLGYGMKYIEYVQLAALSITKTAFYVLVETILKCEQSILVCVRGVTIKDTTRMERENQLKSNIIISIKHRGVDSCYDTKEFNFNTVTITDRFLQEFEDIVDRCQHQLRMTLPLCYFVKN